MNESTTPGCGRLPVSRSDLAGVEAHGLSAEGRLLHACCHAVLGGGSGLRVRRDIAQLVLISGVDWRVTAEQATIDGVELVLADAVRTTWGDLGLDPEHGFARWASSLPVDPAQRRAIDGYHQPSATAWGSEGRTTLAVLGRLDRIKFLTGLAIPSRASLRARDRTWWQHLQFGTKILLRRT